MFNVDFLVLFVCEAQTSWIQRKTIKQARKELKSTILRQERMNMAEHSGPVKGRKCNFHFKIACMNLKWEMEIEALMRKFCKQTEIFSLTRPSIKH